MHGNMGREMASQKNYGSCPEHLTLTAQWRNGGGTVPRRKLFRNYGRKLKEISATYFCVTDPPVGETTKLARLTVVAMP